VPEVNDSCSLPSSSLSAAGATVVGEVDSTVLAVDAVVVDTRSAAVGWKVPGPSALVGSDMMPTLTAMAAISVADSRSPTAVLMMVGRAMMLLLGWLEHLKRYAGHVKSW